MTTTMHSPAPRTVEELSRCFARHRAALLRRCRRNLGGCDADAEDAVARVALAVVRAAPATQELRNPTAWLFELADNASVDIRRARSRRREASLDDIVDEDANRLPSVVHPEPDSERILLIRDSLLWLREAISALPPSLRIPLMFRVEDDLSYDEMAERLLDTPENLRKRVQTARQLLRDAQALRDSAVSKNQRRAERPALASLLAPSRALQPIIVAASAGAARRTVWLPLVAPLPQYTEKRHRRLLRYVQEHPTGWRKSLELADMLLGAGRVDEAIDHYRAVASRCEDAADARMRLALALEQQGRTEEAARLFDALGEDADAEASRDYVRGLAERARGHTESAANHFRRAVNLAQQSPAPAVALGALLWTRGRPAAALDAFDRALAADPDDIAALLLGHDAAFIAGKTAEAKARLDRAIAAAPDSVPALLRLLERNVRKGEIGGRANEPLERLRKLAPELAEVHAARAAHLRAQGLEEEARKVLLDFVQAHPDDAHGWLACARSAFASGAVDEAASAIERATALDPHSAEIGGEALRIASHARFVDLSTLVDSMLSRFPDHWPIAAGAALAICVSGGAPERALSISARALDLEPDLPLALLIHGEVLARIGRVSEAMAVLETGLLRLPPGDGHLQAAPALLRMAELCRGRGDIEAAASLFARAASAAAIARGQDLARARVWEEAARAGHGNRGDTEPMPPSVEARGFCAGAAA